MPYIMRYADSPHDEPAPFDTLDAACATFMKRAGELRRFGQPVEAALYFVRYDGTRENYPDFALRLGPRGGLVRERA